MKRMVDKEQPGLTKQVNIQGWHILAGIGGVDRQCLATFLAFFDEGRFLPAVASHARRVSKSLKEKTGFSVPADASNALKARYEYWHGGALSDDQLRVLLWFKVRDSLGLDPSFCVSVRATHSLAEDVVARLLHAVDPPKLWKSTKRWLNQRGWLSKGEPAVTLADVVVPVMDELLMAQLSERGQSDSRMMTLVEDEQARREALVESLAAMANCTEDELESLLRRVGSDTSSGKALLITGIVGGVLAGIGTGVNAAGFGAYIFAAKMSAYASFVSGPMATSILAVLSSPITLGLGSAAALTILGKRSDKAMRLGVTQRVIALLATNGLAAKGHGLEVMRRAFRTVDGSGVTASLTKSSVRSVEEIRQTLDPIWSKTAFNAPSVTVLRQLHKPVISDPVEKRSADLRGRTGQPEPDEAKQAAWLTGLTLGDVLFSFAAINPKVINSADYSRLADISGPVTFSQVAALLHDGSAERLMGGANHLKGYVAEHAVAAELASQGHAVSFPEVANEPGWDLLVDGERFQVKFHADIGGLRGHFDKYDYPVIANTEHAENLPEEFADKVFFVDGVSNELVNQITDSSLSHGADALDPSVIQWAGLVSVFHGVSAYRKHQLTRSQLFEQILLDGTLRVGLAAGGMYVGAGVGVFFFGPAGGWVFGALTPVLAQMQTTRVRTWLSKQNVSTQAFENWRTEMHQELDALQASAAQALKSKAHTFLAKRKAIGPADGTDIDHYLRWRFDDEQRFAWESYLKVRVVTREQWPAPEQRMAELLRRVMTSGLHPVHMIKHQRSLDEKLRARPGLGEILKPTEVKRGLNWFDKVSHQADQRIKGSRLGRWFKA